MQNELITYFEELLRATNIPIRHIEIPCADWTWFDQGFRTNLLGTDPERWAEYMNRNLERLEQATVYHYTDAFRCSYTLVKYAADNALVIGPFLFDRIREDAFEKLFLSLKLPEQTRIITHSFYDSLPVIPSQSMYESAIIVTADRLLGKDKYKITYRESDTPDEWQQFSSDYSKVPDNPFERVERAERQIELEKGLTEAVMNGDEMPAAEKAIQLATLMCKRHLTGELRDMKNVLIVLNTLLRKAAEYAGVHPVHLNTLTDTVAQKSELLTNVEQLQNYLRKAVRAYCQAVRDFETTDCSQPIRKVITCIRTNPAADLSLRYFAKLLNINPSYLSALFTKEVGVPLTEYVNRERISHAKLLLVSTDLPVKHIAARCGFSDLRYFSRVFKQLCGETPSAYREENTYGHNLHRHN